MAKQKVRRIVRRLGGPRRGRPVPVRAALIFGAVILLPAVLVGSLWLIQLLLGH